MLLNRSMTDNSASTAHATPADAPPASLHVGPDRFYTPPRDGRRTRPTSAAQGVGSSVRRTGGRHSGGPAADSDRVTDRSMAGNVIICSAPSGGIGLSVLSAMLTWELTDRGRSCALVDADFLGGGLDVLLGIEHEPGMRFDAVKAPLGHVEGQSLNQQLPVWHGVHVLAFNPWSGKVPKWWEAQAAIEALAAVNDVVVVDAGATDGSGLMSDHASTRAFHLVATELSVLGMARAKPYIDRIDGVQSAQGTRQPRVPSQSGSCVSLAVVGVHPRGATKRERLLNVEEASEYLGRHVKGPVRHHAKLQYEILEGMGIAGIFRSARPTMVQLAQDVERALKRHDPDSEEAGHESEHDHR